jgi:hypothetical protein
VKNNTDTTLENCKCGKEPTIGMVTECPAQYRVECACGKTALGCYYAHHEKGFRHTAAKKSAMEEWNGKQRRRGSREAG